MSTEHQNAVPEMKDPGKLPKPDEQLPDLKIYSHASLFYWWPVWVTGFIMAALTYAYHETLNVAGREVWIHPNKNLGLIYAAVLLAVLVFTNISLRGWASIGVIGILLFFVVLFAWMEVWDEILSLYVYLTFFMNLGFYLVFSSVVFVIWAIAFFFYDRLEFYRFRPGQATHERIVGEATKSYDTRGMVFEKHHEDVFRHWILGLGSGDLRIITSGARKEELVLKNVLFVDWKVDRIQRLIAVKPDDLLKQGNEEG